jgi:hypothetical protein
VKNYLILATLLSVTTVIFAQAPNISWHNRYGGALSNYSYKSVQTNDGGFIIGGRSNSNISFDKSENCRGGLDYWVIKTDSNGIKEWDKTIGGASPNGIEDDVFYSLIQTGDNGFLICGGSNSTVSGDKTVTNNGTTDFWIVKLSSSGAIEWQRALGGSNENVPYCVIQTIDGGYLIGGYSNSNISGDKSENCRGLQDYWIVKLDSFGDVEWDKTFGGDSSDILTSIIQQADGSFLLTGRSNSGISGDKTETNRGAGDYWILKIDSQRNIIWQKTIGGSGFDELTAALLSQDGGFLLAGLSYSNASGEKTENSRGFRDYWIVKIDASGDIEWDKTIGGSGDDPLFGAANCADGGYILTGGSNSPVSGEKTEPVIGGSDGWVVKVNNIGAISWQKTIGGSLGDGFNSVVQTTDDGFYISGQTNSPISGNISISPKGSIDYFAVKLEAEDLSNDSNVLFGLSIYPNPTKGVVNVDFENLDQNVNYLLFNSLGQIISKGTFDSNQNKITFDGQGGFYFLKLMSDKKTHVVKIIKN